MSSRFRSALLWLLLLALPLQGFAAARMMHCGPNHHRMMAASVAAADESHAHAMHAHHHEAGAVHAMHADAADHAAHGTSSVHDLDQLSKFKCSACAACCVGAAIPMAALFVPSLPPADAIAVAVFAPHVDFLSDGLDRPPRHVLA